MEVALDNPNVDDGADGTYHDISSGVLVDKKEGDTQPDPKIVAKEADIEEFALISNSVSELTSKEAPTESTTSMSSPSLTFQRKLRFILTGKAMNARQVLLWTVERRSGRLARPRSVVITKLVGSGSEICCEDLINKYMSFCKQGISRMLPEF